jgi:hypothetical protein
MIPYPNDEGEWKIGREIKIGGGTCFAPPETRPIC